MSTAHSSCFAAKCWKRSTSRRAIFSSTRKWSPRYGSGTFASCRRGSSTIHDGRARAASERVTSLAPCSWWRRCGSVFISRCCSGGANGSSRFVLVAWPARISHVNRPPRWVWHRIRACRSSLARRTVESSLYDEYVRIEDTHWWFRGRRKIITALLRPYLRPPARIIDVGSGGGAVAQALQQFGHVTACDIDVRCAASVARRPGMSFAYGTAEAIPFADGRFDLVTAFDVLEHLDDDVIALREMARVASPTGLIAVTVPAYGWMWGRQDEVSPHRRRYTGRSLRRAITAAGLNPRRLTAFNTILFPGIAALRLSRRLSRRLADRGQTPDPAGLTSDFSMTKPGPLNDLLAATFSAEAAALRVLDLPIGVSLLAIAQRAAS